MKRVSVCMPVYNGERFLRAQLDSILLQLTESDELLISDDGSTDDSLAIIRSYADPRIRLLQEGKSAHPSYNLECCLLAARGDYIFLADQDDVWKANKLVAVLEGLKHYDLVVHDAEVVDANLVQLHPSFYALHGSKRGFWCNFARNSFLGCSMAFRRELLQKALPFPRPIPMHDQWLGMLGLLWFRVGFIPDKLLLYRRHGANASSTSAASRHTLFQQIGFRFWLGMGLLRSIFR